MNEKMKYCPVDIANDKSFSFDHVRVVWNEQITLHQSPTCELSYIIVGSGTRIVGDTTEFFRTGEVVFLPPNMPHEWYFDEFDNDEEGKIENITIQFSADFLEKTSGVFPELFKYIEEIRQIKQAVKFQGNTQKSLQKIMTGMTFENEWEQLLSLLRILVLIGSSNETSIVGSLEKQSKSSVKAQKVARYIVNNFQRKITLDEVARYVGMNRSSFCSFYKKMKGKSFFSDLNEYRINSSCVMLKETSMSVADICFAVGFDDVPHFNRTFKKIKGVSPKEFRKKASLFR
jgi:AraC-like DNA-binding protein/mannose-6-phosphate isomerase-like protein (cupin superfamily)